MRPDQGGRTRIAAVLLLAALLAGCSEPLAWLHRMEGSRLAEPRPAPPNADAPYPNLASVPARPATGTEAGRVGIAQRLERDRRDAAQGGSALPLAPPTAPPVPQPPVVADGAMGASLAAASPRPTHPAAPASPPRPEVAPAPAPSMARIDMPATPPAPPRLPGMPAATAPAPPRPSASAPIPRIAAQVPGAPVGVAFAAGSAILPHGAAAALRQLAATRGGADVQAVGYGEAAGSDPASQAAALPLAYARARAIGTALLQAGVPDGELRLAAEAIGQGGAAAVVK